MRQIKPMLVGHVVGAGGLLVRRAARDWKSKAAESKGKSQSERRRLRPTHHFTHTGARVSEGQNFARETIAITAKKF
jgi:hypothetical protein